MGWCQDPRTWVGKSDHVPGSLEMNNALWSGKGGKEALGAWECWRRRVCALEKYVKGFAVCSARAFVRQSLTRDAGCYLIVCVAGQ